MRDNTSHLVIIFLLTLITLNLFILDLKVFSPSNTVQISDITTVATPIPSPTINPSTSLGASNPLCPIACLSLIQQATSPATLASQGDTLQKTGGGYREIYIPLGNGTTTKSSWDDITGTETLINPTNYGSVREVYFIASLSNPTQNGQVEAQLYNVTDKHMVWGSHMVMKGPASQTLTSGKIVLDNGAKLYRVQIKSTLQFAASLDNAKIRIITQ